MKKLLLIICICISTAKDGFAVPFTDSTKKESYVASYFTNGLGVFKQPKYWNEDKWITASSCAAFTFIFVTLDDAINQPFITWQSPFAKKLGNTGYNIGHTKYQLGFTGISYLTGVLTKSQPLKNFAADNLQAQIFTSGITILFKELSHRARPITGADNYAFSGPFKNGQNESFFSGHTSVAFSTANMIYLYSHKKWWVGLLSYGAATGVGISRMQKQAHWASDVFLGSVMGIAISSYVYKQQQKRRQLNKIILP
jgi:hypothetical protein